MPLQINLALGKGDVATALAGAREVLAAGGLDSRPSELITASGAAFAWAGLADEARSTIAVALARTEAEGRVTAHAMALVAASVVEFHSADPPVARAAANRALEFASASGLGEYHGIAPAIAIHAATGGPGPTVTDIDRALGLARRAATTVGLAFVLTVGGDVLLRAGIERGSELLDEARQVIGACADPGITGSMLDRAAARHRVASRDVTMPGMIEPLSTRELAVLAYLPSELSIPEIARELYVSPNTVKSQCSAIYRKLAVSSRRDAVEIARRRHLL
jgi:LuxR family maltose regulon positive regulatory protein